ncbi:hypothetical protein [Kribbella endophytica]
MNLDELRDRLHDQADEIDLAEPAPLHTLRRRAGRIRRRRIATGAGVAAVCCAVVAAAAIGSSSGMLDRTEPATSPTPSVSVPTAALPDGLPSAKIVPSPKDYVKNGIRYQAKVADAELLDAQIGGSSVSFQFDAAQELVDFRAFCALPGEPAAAELAKVVVRIDGRAVTSRPCTRFPEPQAGEQPGIGVPGLGIQLAKSYQVTATVVDGNNRPIVRDGMVTGVGVYARGPGREVREGYWLPLRIQHHGRIYRWADSMTAPVVSGAGPQGAGLDTPGFTPCLVAFGTVGVPGPHSFEIAGTTGGEQFTVHPADGAAGSIFFDAVPSQAAGSFELRQTGKTPTVGDLVVAIYLPE